MTEKALLCPRARTRRLLPALLLVLSPTLSGAAPPVDVSPPDASQSNRSPRETLPNDAFSTDVARRTPASSGKIRIGRIFFSPAERRHRHADKTPAAGAPGAHAARGQRLQINGAVSSNTQGRAVWVNGAAIENSAAFKSAWTDRAGNVWLRDDQRTPRLVRPGQAVDPASGAIEDLLPAGSVARR
jgi:hypothetical protein